MFPDFKDSISSTVTFNDHLKLLKPIWKYYHFSNKLNQFYLNGIMIPRHVYIFFPVSQQLFLRQSQIVPNTSPIKIISLYNCQSFMYYWLSIYISVIVTKTKLPVNSVILLCSLLFPTATFCTMPFVRLRYLNSYLPLTLCTIIYIRTFLQTHKR